MQSINSYKYIHHVSIEENSSYTLKSKYSLILQRYLRKVPRLSKLVNLKNNTLSFADYIIGEISIDNLNIQINPRIKGLTINNYYEMKLYINGIKNDYIKAFLGNTHKYGVIDNLSSLYLNILLRLVKNGLEGTFVSRNNLSKYIHGKILVSKITPLDLRFNKLPIKYNIYTLNTFENKFLKMALNKCRILIDNDHDLELFNIINSYFDEVSVLPSEYKFICFKINYNQKTYDNKLYPLALNIAKRILDDLNINMDHQKFLCSSFLMNSNDLFEKYSRQILKNNLRHSVTKWDKAKEFGRYTINTQSFTKSYVPDVLIDYHPDIGSAQIVLDAKNKNVSDPHELAKVPDIYEVLFYCKHLHTKRVGLMYPLYGRRQPIPLNLYKSNIKFYMFFIDFKLPIDKRNELFVEDVHKTLGAN